MKQLTKDRLTVSSVILIPLAALALTWSITGYACNEYSLLDCDTQDHFDEVYDRQDRIQEQELQEQRMREFERELEYQQEQRDRDQHRQRWDDWETDKGTNDVICHYLNDDC